MSTKQQQLQQQMRIEIESGLNHNWIQLFRELEMRQFIEKEIKAISEKETFDMEIVELIDLKIKQMNEVIKMMREFEIEINKRKN
jgi:hypothetical protein